MASASYLCLRYFTRQIKDFKYEIRQSAFSSMKIYIVGYLSGMLLDVKINRIMPQMAHIRHFYPQMP